MLTSQQAVANKASQRSSHQELPTPQRTRLEKNSLEVAISMRPKNKPKNHIIPPSGPAVRKLSTDLLPTRGPRTLFITVDCVRLNMMPGGGARVPALRAYFMAHSQSTLEGCARTMQNATMSRLTLAVAIGEIERSSSSSTSPTASASLLSILKMRFRHF